MRVVTVSVTYGTAGSVKGMRVVTVSARYGTAGSVIGPAVAGRLGVPSMGRAIPGAVAGELGCTLQEALAHDDRAAHGRPMSATSTAPPRSPRSCTSW